jgi:hypothetical protein
MYYHNLNHAFTVENQVKGWEICEGITSYSLLSLLLRVGSKFKQAGRLRSETSRERSY